MKTLRILALAVTFAGVTLTSAQAFDSTDTVVSTLTKQTGKQAELRLKSGESIAGKIEAVGSKAVHITALKGQEFFEAVVDLDQVAAVITRTEKK